MSPCNLEMRIKEVHQKDVLLCGRAASVFKPLLGLNPVRNLVELDWMYSAKLDFILDLK